MAGIDLTRRMLLTALAAAPLAERAAAQDTWPSRPVRVMVPYPPAGGADTTARIVYAKLSENLGQPFAIENRGGAGGTIGEAVIAKADPDGYAILHDATAFSVNGSLYQDLPFDYRRDFEPVILIGEVANVLVATPSLPVMTVADVIAYAKARPDGIDMASSGNGTLQHLLLELFARSGGITIHHIPYRGGGIAITDVMAGQVPFLFSNASSSFGLIKSGKVKAIAHTGKGRLASLPDIPAMSDTLPGFEGYDWNGVFVPHGTPVPVVQKLNVSLNAVIASPQVIARFIELNVQSHENTPAEFGAYIEAQMMLWSRVVKEANIKLG
ncbi:MAG TPA: tripartite tricarboxylate transporter substrate binding protein [Urbifossiella sp.]|jgi:tripartite-type tricarboxylate transporter receptor subunit TctC